ncbi:unnamed protein product [Absidia cylindrospora]
MLKKLECPYCQRIGTIANIASSTQSSKFQCTNSKCSSTSIAPSQVNRAMNKNPSKRRPPPSTASEPECIPQEPDTITNSTPIALPPTAATPGVAFEHHPALPNFMTNIITQMNEVRAEQQLFREQQRVVRQEHEELKATNDQLALALSELQLLKTSLQEKEQVIQNQQQEIEDLRQQMLNSPATQGLSASKHAPQGPWGNHDKVQELHNNLADGPTSQNYKKQQAAARHFSPPSSNQGFTHVYIPIRARLRIGQIRKNLKQLHIDNNRVLDINYPAMNTTSLLVHNDFVPELTTRLTKAGIKTIDDFDPTNHQHLRDPKYLDKSNDERTEIAINLHHQRMIRSVEFIRAPAKFAVARCFAKEGWITQEQLASILESNEPTSAASAFILEAPTTDSQMDPTSMEDDEPNTSTNHTNPDMQQ